MTSLSVKPPDQLERKGNETEETEDTDVANATNTWKSECIPGRLTKDGYGWNGNLNKLNLLTTKVLVHVAISSCVGYATLHVASTVCTVGRCVHSKSTRKNLWKNWQKSPYPQAKEFNPKCIARRCDETCQK